MRRRHLLRAVAAGLLLPASATLAACSTGSDAVNETAGSQNRFVQGDGRTIVYPAGQRKPAPAVTGDTLDGARYDLASARGKVVVINFFASWCNPCRLESAALQATYDATKDKGVAFLGIDIRDNRDPAKAFVSGRYTYPCLFDPTGRVSLGFTDVPPQTIPATLILDRDGRIAAVIRDSVQQGSLTALVNQIATG